MRIAEFTLPAFRLLLAAVFLLAGATKLVDPVGWRKALRDFSVRAGLARPMMVLLPVLELAVAAALIPASLAWYGACGAVALLTAFMIAVGIAMIRGRKPDCQCFGQLHSAPVGRSTLIRNAVLAACAGWLASRGRRRAGPDLWAWYSTSGVIERKAALVARCLAVLLFFYLLARARPRNESVKPEPPATDAIDDDKAVPEERPAAAVKRRIAPTAQAPAQAPAPARSNAMGIGLPIGTPAPEFELPGMNGEKRSSQSLRKQGRDVLLVFTSPFCKACQSLPSDLVSWAKEMETFPNIVLISRGTPQENRPKLKEFGTAQVLLQRNFEVGEMYDCSATPAAVLVGADGLIQSDLAQGGVEIRKLLFSWPKRGNPNVQNTAERSSAPR